MPVEMRMWRIDGDEPKPLTASVLPAEKDLHEFLKRDPSLLGERLLVIGSEVITPYGSRLDLLAIDADGNLNLLELKRDKTPREVVAQVLDYGSWASTLSRDDIIDMATKHLDQPFEAAFEDVFGSAPPDELNGDLSLTIVAAELDASSERIVNYLRDFGVPINAVFFSYLEDDNRRYLARSWLAGSDEETAAAPKGSKKSKRAPWNQIDWYVSYGGGRDWADARRSTSSPPVVAGSTARRCARYQRARVCGSTCPAPASSLLARRSPPHADGQKPSSRSARTG